MTTTMRITEMGKYVQTSEYVRWKVSNNCSTSISTWLQTWFHGDKEFVLRFTFVTFSAVLAPTKCDSWRYVVSFFIFVFPSMSITPASLSKKAQHSINIINISFIHSFIFDQILSSEKKENESSQAGWRRIIGTVICIWLKSKSGFYQGKYLKLPQVKWNLNTEVRKEVGTNHKTRKGCTTLIQKKTHIL